METWLEVQTASQIDSSYVELEIKVERLSLICSNGRCAETIRG